MRVLHTSDWHLGRSLLSAPLLEHQRTFVEWLVDCAQRESVDAIVIAGDVYDRAVPTLEAVGILEDALLRLSRIAPVVLIPGNHDSPTRLGFAGPLLAASGVHIRSTVDALDSPVLLGAGDARMAVYGIPFLHPDLHATALEAERTHESVLRSAMDRVRADLRRRDVARSVVVAHAFVTGARSSDSERDVSVGGIGDVPADVFDGIDYVALGHLHRPQEVQAPGETRACYPGSPLAYSFSEENQDKGVIVIDFPDVGPVSVRREHFTSPRSMATIRGRLDDLLAEPSFAEVEDHWIRAVLTDPRRPANPMDRIRSRFPHALELSFEPDHGPGDEPTRMEIVNPLTADPVDVGCAFIEHVTDTPATELERRTLQEVVDAVRAAQVPR